jgi:hypothetical protein
MVKQATILIQMTLEYLILALLLVQGEVRFKNWEEYKKNLMFQFNFYQVIFFKCRNKIWTFFRLIIIIYFHPIYKAFKLQQAIYKHRFDSLNDFAI